MDHHTFEIELPESVNENDVFEKIDRSDDKYLVYHIVESYGGEVVNFIEDGSGEVDIEVDCVF